MGGQRALFMEMQQGLPVGAAFGTESRSSMKAKKWLWRLSLRNSL